MTLKILKMISAFILTIVVLGFVINAWSTHEINRQEMNSDQPAYSADPSIFLSKTVSPQEANRNFNMCILRSISDGDSQVMSIRECIDMGVLWCNKIGLRTSTIFTVSPVTGRVIIDNQKCVYKIDTQYKILSSDFEAELRNYITSENNGAPYQPLIFDIRAFKR